MDKIIEDVCSQYERDQYAMYLRKSRADIELEAMGEGETLARHKTMLYTLAARHDIHPDQITVYQEIVSGESIQDRPKVQELLSDVYAKKYKAVLVVEIERLARGNTKDQGEVADAFSFSSTHIITPAKIYDPNDEFDQEYFEFGLFMSRREYKTIRRRLTAGKDQAAKEGNYMPSRIPFGFTVTRPSKKERILVEDPNTSKYVKMIFNWYTEDRKPTSWIARKLTNMGVETPTKQDHWERATIKDILFNYHYIGKIVWGGQSTIRVKDPVTGNIEKKRVRGEPEIYEGKHKGFISEEQFHKVREIYGSKAPVNINLELVNPLSGVLFCKDCGRQIRYQAYSGNTANRFIHYQIKTCSKKSIDADILIDAVVEALKACIKDFEVKLENNSNDESDRHKEYVAALQAELTKQEAKRKRLFDSWESDDGLYTRDEFIERKQMYAAAIEKLKAQLKEAKENAPEPVDYQEKIVSLHQVIDCIKDDSIPAKDKNVFLKQNLNKITYDLIDLGRGKGAIPVLDVFPK